MKKGDRVRVTPKGDNKMATIVDPKLDSKGRIRVRVDNFPMDISIKEEDVHTT